MASTIRGTIVLISSAKFPVCPARMDRYMCLTVSSQGTVILKMDNLDIKRGSNSFLPPPAFPIAAKKPAQEDSAIHKSIASNRAISHATGQRLLILGPWIPSQGMWVLWQNGDGTDFFPLNGHLFKRKSNCLRLHNVFKLILTKLHVTFVTLLWNRTVEFRTT